MRVPILIKMYNDKLEIYGDGENFSLEIKQNNEPKILNYSVNDDMFKPVLVISPNDIIYLKDLNYPYIFHKTDEERWEVYNIAKNKVLKNRKKYLLAITVASAKRGLFHNIQNIKKTGV